MIRLAKVTALVMATLLGLAAVWALRGPVMVFLLSLLVAAAARAPVDYLIRRGLPKVAASLIYLLGFLVVAGVVLAVIYRIGGEHGELGRLARDFRELYDHAIRYSGTVPWIERNVMARLPPREEMMAALVGNHGEQALRLVLGTAFGLFSVMIDSVFVLVLSIYWTIDRDYFERLWLSLLPLPHRVSARKLLRMLESELGAYARSEITQSLLAGLVLGTGYWLLGLKFPALLALIAALSWLLPWVGAIIALAALVAAELPALVLDWPGSLLPVAAAAIFTAAVFVILETRVEPRLFNRQRYNSLFIVLAVMALAETYGILGLLLGPLVAVAVQAAVEHIEHEVAVASTPRSDLAALQTRLADLRAGAAADSEIPLEWMSIVERLSALIAQAREAVGEAR